MQPCAMPSHKFTSLYLIPLRLLEWIEINQYVYRFYAYKLYAAEHCELKFISTLTWTSGPDLHPGHPCVWTWIGCVGKVFQSHDADPYWHFRTYSATYGCSWLFLISKVEIRPANSMWPVANHGCNWGHLCLLPWTSPWVSLMNLLGWGTCRLQLARDCLIRWFGTVKWKNHIDGCVCLPDQADELWFHYVNSFCIKIPKQTNPWSSRQSCVQVRPGWWTWSHLVSLSDPSVFW